MNVSSDCSKDSVLMQVRNYEFSKDDIVVPDIYQGNRRILLSDSENDIVSSDYDTNENIIVNGVDDRKLQDTVLSILDPFVGFHHHIYMDNYYNSVNIAELFLQRNTRVYGTIRANREFPPNLKNTILKEHETKFAGKGQVLLQLSQEKRDRLAPKRQNAIERTRPTPRYEPSERLSQDLKKKTSISTNCKVYHYTKQPMLITDTSGLIFDNTMNIRGPFPKTERENKYILSIQDQITKICLAEQI
ncbi:hypothetical protein HZH68_015449 [Vespula germanica]|uniref:PiggyBac transposable element-derived protein domain-containing protein n=1 Tax=Vespula germanica TaxID=30212 RepID=A0A834MRK0_VESGE|nr:hypothetical protein HZH68_015449 [Vespula germanica]